MMQEPPADKKPQSTGAFALWILSLLLLGLGLWKLLAPSLDHPPEVWRRTTSRNNLKELGIALHSYHEEYEQFPPGMLLPKAGGPAYGWPVYLLPFTESKSLYGSIDLTKPYWDPDNQAVMQAEVSMYHNPMFDDTTPPAAALQYALNSRVFQPNRYTRIPDITDGLSHTFAGGEIADGIQMWYQPDHTRDPALGLNKGPHTFGSPYYGTRYGGQVQMLMLDGAVRGVSDDIDPAVLKALATPAAGDDPGDF